MRDGRTVRGWDLVGGGLFTLGVLYMHQMLGWGRGSVGGGSCGERLGRGSWGEAAGERQRATCVYDLCDQNVACVALLPLGRVAIAYAYRTCASVCLYRVPTSCSYTVCLTRAKRVLSVCLSRVTWALSSSL